MAAPVLQQGVGELDEAEVVDGLLVVADQERSALLQPGERSLHDPAAGGVSLLTPPVEFLLADPADVRDVPAPAQAASPVGLSYPLSKQRCWA